MLRIANSVSRRHILVATSTTFRTYTTTTPVWSTSIHTPSHPSVPSISQSTNIRTFSSSSWNWTDLQNKSPPPHPNNPNAPPTQQEEGSSSSPTATLTDSTQNEILTSCESIHSSIMPLNEKLRGPLARHSDRGTCLPFVFLVGNHSSGKSSFINYALGRDVQTAGVAPTDDCFTVITPGLEDSDQDGPALIGDPDMGFSPLRQFGPTLIHHTQLKVRSNTNSSSFMMVDSPGMIDSPMNQNGMSMSSGTKVMDRGYDFQGVVQWFAERADVVLLFFDPDKPGTTGETLSVLLHSLAGMEHKLLIVLNKADQFRKIHDFARAYGSLCWNLSKVIPRKDLPRIFTMCLPVKGSNSPTLSGGLADLQQTRDDVVAEVMKAPKRRIDNVITHLTDSVHQLLMHAKVAEDVRRRYAKLLWNNRLQEATSLVTGVGLASLGIYTELPMQFTGGIVASTVLGVGGLRWFNSTKLSEAEDNLTTSEELGVSFQRTHSNEIGDADEFVASTWQRIRGPLKNGMRAKGLGDFPAVEDDELRVLNRILEEDIPKLRRLASPTHFGSKENRYGA